MTQETQAGSQDLIEKRAHILARMGILQDELDLWYAQLQACTLPLLKQAAKDAGIFCDVYDLYVVEKSTCSHPKNLFGKHVCYSIVSDDETCIFRKEYP